MRLAWPLTGRTEELRFIETATRGADGPGGAVLAGEAGVGKTRLAREALRVAGARGQVVRWVSGTAAARALPFGAFATVLPTLDGDPTQLLRRAADALVTDAGGEGVAVGVDDAHLLDELSALVVQQLVLRSLATVVVTVRTGEPAPDAITSLWKDGQLDRLEVQPLSEGESAQLLAAVLGGDVTARTSRRMWAMTRGNVLFMRQLVDGELDAGRLSEQDGSWRWESGQVVSPGLAELVESRMGGLSDDLREVVDLLALGEPLGVELLGGLTSPSSVEEIEERGLLAVVRTGRRIEARLAHPLYGEVRRARIGQLRARRLRGRIAQAMAAAGGRREDDTMRRAILLLESDLPAEPAVFDVAAGRAIQLLDMTLGERLARAAVDVGNGFDSRMILGYAQSWLGMGHEAEAATAALPDLAESDIQRAEATFLRAANRFWVLRDPAGSEAELAAAEQMVDTPAARAALASVRSAVRGCLGQPEDALRSAATAFGYADLPDHQVMLATWGTVLGLAAGGRTDEVPEVAQRAYSAVRSFHTAVLRFGLADFHMTALRLGGYVDDAAAVADRLVEDGADLPGMPPLMAATLAGHGALGLGDLTTARRVLTTARTGLSIVGNSNGWLFRCLLGLSQVLALSGDAEGAAAALAALDTDGPSVFGYLDPEVDLAQAWVAAAQGTVSAARDHARAAVRSAERTGHVGFEVLALQTAVRLGDPSGAARLAELAGRVDGPRAGVSAEHATALERGDGAALQTVARQLERMGDRAAAADAWAQSAVCHTVAGLVGSASASAARAQRLAVECGGLRTPALAAAARPLPLTDREREIVTLAGAGLSNRRIAERLVVSVRTVEGHLYRAMAKLGARSRADLVDILNSG